MMDRFIMCSAEAASRICAGFHDLHFHVAGCYYLFLGYSDEEFYFDL